MVAKAISDIDRLRGKMMQAHGRDLRYDKAEDALVLFDRTHRFERAILLRDGKAYLRTVFEHADRRIEHSISPRGAGQQIDVWLGSAAQIAPVDATPSRPPAPARVGESAPAACRAGASLAQR